MQVAVTAAMAHLNSLHRTEHAQTIHSVSFLLLNLTIELLSVTGAEIHVIELFFGANATPAAGIHFPCTGETCDDLTVAEMRISRMFILT